MICPICGRDGLSEKELVIHLKYFHKKQAQQSQNKKQTQQPQKVSAGACPECGLTLFYQEGCVTCMICGYNKCG